MDKLDPSQNVKPFWDVCGHYFSIKHSRGDTNITFSDKDELVLKDIDMKNAFNENYGRIFPPLHLFSWSGVSS